MTRKETNIRVYCSCGKCGEVLNLEFGQWDRPVDIQLEWPISEGWKINYKERDKSLCPVCARRVDTMGTAL